MQPIITNVLINNRWRFNQLIDNNMSNLPDAHHRGFASQMWTNAIHFEKTGINNSSDEDHWERGCVAFANYAGM